MVSLEAIVPRVNGLAIIDPLAKFTAADRIDAEEGLFIDKAVVFLVCLSAPKRPWIATDPPFCHRHSLRRSMPLDV